MRLPPEIQAKVDKYRAKAQPGSDAIFDAERGVAYFAVTQTDAGIRLMEPIVVKVPTMAVLTFAANLILAMQGQLPVAGVKPQ